MSLLVRMCAFDSWQKKKKREREERKKERKKEGKKERKQTNSIVRIRALTSPPAVRMRVP